MEWSLILTNIDILKLGRYWTMTALPLGLAATTRMLYVQFEDVLESVIRHLTPKDEFVPLLIGENRIKNPIRSGVTGWRSISIHR